MELLDKPIRLPFSGKVMTLKYILIHMAYWILITGFFIYEKKYLIYKASMPYFFACVAGRVLLLIVVGYLNLQYFLPRYLLRKRYLHYALAVFLSIAGYLVLQSLYDYYLYGFVIGPLRNSGWLETLSYNLVSTVWYLALMLALKLSIDWYEQQRILQKVRLENLEAEVKFLRSQINPHFLFNVLNNLYALTLKKSELAPEVVLKLSDMMEYMLYDSDHTSVPLEKEIAWLSNYLALEKMRLGGKNHVELTVTGDYKGVEIAPLLLIPLVENAFKHGIDLQSEKGYLRCTLKADSQSLSFLVGNSKPVNGRKNEKGGIGLTNLRQRLDRLYPGRYGLQLRDDGQYYQADLSIRFT